MRSVKPYSVVLSATISFLFLLVLGATGPAMAAQDALICPADRINSNGNICTASDVSLAAAAVAVSQTGLTCAPGETIDVAIAGTVNLRKGTRYDIGVWVSTDGKPMDLRGGSNGAPDEGGAQACEVVPLPFQTIAVDTDPGIFIIDSLDDAATPHDCYDTEAANNGDESTGFVLTSERDSIINGLVDSNNDGSIDVTDDTTAGLRVFGAHIIAGGVDIDDSGTIDGLDDGIWNGFAVQDGVIDVDGDGTYGANDGTDDSAQSYNDLVTMTCVAGPTGKLALETLVSWHVPSDAALVCNASDPDSFGPLQSSKCSVNSSEVDVDIVGKLTIGKIALPDDDSDFEFTYTNDSPPLADQDPNDLIPNISPASPFTLGHLESDVIFAEIGTGPATIVITETNIPAGWDLANLTCSGDDTVETVIDVVNKTATVTLQYNDVNPLASQANVLCSFTNRTLPSLTVVKNTAGGNGTFDFQFVDGGAATDFDLNTGMSNTAMTTFSNLQPGTDYDLVELIPDGWSLGSASCSNGSGTFAITGTAPNQLGTISDISLTLGENVTCTFNNALGAVTTLSKVTVGGDDSFGFTSTLPDGNFVLTTASGSSPLASTTDLAAGQYTITENAITGWELTDIQCTESADQDSQIELVNRRVILNVQVGESISCVFTNEKHGTLRVIKQTLPDGDPASFTFTGTVAGSISDGQNLSFTGPAGVFTTDESALAGWDLTGIRCTGAVNSTISIGGTAEFVAGDTAVSANIAPGEEILCIYTNTKRGSVTIIKNISAVGPAVQDFGFTSDLPGNLTFTLSPVDAANGDELEVLDLVPGLYSVSEDDPTSDGWSLTSATCSDDSPVDGILVDPGEALTCTFVNSPLGSATIVKNSVGGNGQFDFTWGTGTNTNIPEGEASTFSLTTLAGTASSDFTNKLLINEAYDLTETDTPAAVGPYGQTWSLTDTTCEDATGNSTFNPGENGADATLVSDSGETVSCTFTNTLDGTLVIRKQTIPDLFDLDFSFTGTVAGLTGMLKDYDLASAELTHTGQPGTYGSTETVPVGWDLTDISCSGATSSTISIGGTTGFVDGDTDVSVNLAAGETVICTFTNTKQGSLSVIKNAVGDDGVFTFNHNVVGETSPFDIDTSVDSTKLISTTLSPGSYLVSEVVPTNWDLSNIACEGNTDSTITIGASGGFDPGDTGVTVGLLSGEDIICTFTNTVITKQVTLQKAWVGGVATDTAALTASGTLSTEMATSTATGGDQNDTTNTAVLTARAGETINLSEALGNANTGNYSTDFSCSTSVNAPGYTSGGITATLLVDEADTDITCTFTNTVNTAQVALFKDWIGGVTNDTAELTAAGSLSSEMATSTSTGGDQTDLSNVPVLTALVGETVTLSEVLGVGNTGDYITSFACLDAANMPTYTEGETSATLVIDAADSAINCIYSNSIKTATITLQKAWVGGVAADTAALTATGTLSTEMATSTASGGDQTDTTNTAVLTALVGETVTLSEILGGGNTGDYTTGFSCSGSNNAPTYTAGNTSATLLIDAADTAITCTYTNSVNTATVTLQKAWVDGVVNDMASLTATGALSTEMATSTATGGDQTDTTNTAVLTALVGETVTLSELLSGGNTGDYSSAISCANSENQPMVLNPTSSTLLIGAADTAITCTYTNTVNTARLTLQKAWLGAVNGDTAALTASGTLGNQMALSTAAGGDQDDTINTAVLTALVGETVTLSEVLGGTGEYNASFSCSGANNSPGYTVGDTSATLLIDSSDTDITCTYTNNVKVAGVTLQKAWVGAVANDSADLNIAATEGPAMATSTAAGGDQTDLVNTAFLADALVGETVTFTETLGGTGDYTTSFNCLGATNTPSYTPGATTATLEIDEGDFSITCTFTNTINTAELTLQKAWVGGVANDTSDLSIQGANGPIAATSVSAGGDETDTVNTAMLKTLVGETVTLSEVLGGGNSGDYAANLVCNGAANAPTYTAGDTSATLLIDAADTDITCTYTNTINTAQLTLQKAWIDGVADDTAALTMAGTLSTESATSTATGGDQTDTVNTAVMDALVGETVTLSEVLGGNGDYTAGFTCAGATNAPTYTAGESSATLLIDAADTAIVCTYTNTRTDPVINLAKAVNGPATLEADGTYTVGYTITASNSGGYGTYNVLDTFSPGSGITLTAGTPPVAVYQAGTENTQTGMLGVYSSFVTGEGLASGLNERWLVTANFTIDPALLDTASSSCESSTPVVNTGFYNYVEGSETDSDLTDNAACTGLEDPIINLAKTVASGPTLEADGTYTVVYTITASNTGGPGAYEITDTMSPGDGITVVSDATYPGLAYAGGETQTGMIAVPPLANGDTWVTAEGLVANATESWTVTASFAVDPAMLDPATSSCDPATPVVNTGFYNYVEGSASDVDLTDNAACTGLADPGINLAKTVTSGPTLEADGTYTVVYSITATNTGGVGVYDVVDTFSPGDGITLNTADAVYMAGSEDSQTGTTAAYPNFVAEEGLGEGMDEAWTVTANFTVDPAMLDPATSTCDPATPVVNTGFYNYVEGSSTDSDLSDNEACTGLADPGINLAKTVNGPAVLEADGTYTVIYTITATNTSGPGSYDLLDEFLPGAGITLNTADAVYLAGSEDSQSGTLGAYPNFVTDEGLAGGMDESWTVTANFTIDLSQVTAESANCDTSDTGDNNTGFNNSVTGSDSDTDLTDNEACTELPLPTITVIKAIDGGEALPTDFVLTLTGADGINDSGVDYASGDSTIALAGVTYTLSEAADQVEDYFENGIACVDDESQLEVVHPVTLTEDQSVTCTLTNTLNEIVFEVLAEACVNNAPIVTYDVTTTLGDSDDVAITWIKNDGSDEIVESLTGQAAAGDLLWPGAAIVDGVAVAWPGWSCDAQGQNCVAVDDGLVPTMQLKFDINPTSTVIVEYPPATVACGPQAPREMLPVPVNDRLALILLTLMMLATGWYFRPTTMRRF